MRIVALSDTHTLQAQVPMPEGEFDVLIHAGDMGNLGKVTEYETIGNWFRSVKHQYKYQIIVPGNHDWGFMNHPEFIMNSYFDPDVILLIDKGVEIDGVKFYGCPWMPQFYDWAFMRREDELIPYYNAIPDDTEVLITHCPPHSILDKATRRYRLSEAHHYDRCGSTTLYERVKQLPKLKHHIFGHIHYGYGTEKIGDVTFHNVASLNENYYYQNPPQIIELNKEITMT
jgi:Icc-related predicted phosphoesterase